MWSDAALHLEPSFRGGGAVVAGIGAGVAGFDAGCVLLMSHDEPLIHASIGGPESINCCRSVDLRLGLDSYRCNCIPHQAFGIVLSSNACARCRLTQLPRDAAARTSDRG